MIRAAIEVDIDSLATMPARGPWALRVLVGAMINHAADEVGLTWPEAPPSVEVLARAVAGGR